MYIPSIANLIGGRVAPAASGRTLEKLRPADGAPSYTVARSDDADVSAAVAAARSAQPAWAMLTPVERGRLVRELALALQARREEAAELVGGRSANPWTWRSARSMPPSRWASSQRVKDAGSTDVQRPHRCHIAP